MNNFKLIFFVIQLLILFIKCDDVSFAIENIGQDVKKSLDFNELEEEKPIRKYSLPISNRIYLKKSKTKYKPTLNQVAYLIQNKNNPSPNIYTRAQVILKGNSGVHGLINLKQIKDGPVLIFGTIQGLPREGKFGFHFHEFPIQGMDCDSAGEHFNPYGSQHGGHFEKHLGDLGNIIAQYNGVSHVVLTEHDLSLRGPHSILGRSLVVHLNEDDLGTQPNRESKKTGNSGPKISCGTVTLLPFMLDAENKFN